MRFKTILLGDRDLRAYGWVVVQHGAARAILTPGGRGQVLHLFACDERLRPDPAQGALTFPSLAHARAWIEPRLEQIDLPDARPDTPEGSPAYAPAFAPAPANAN